MRGRAAGWLGGLARIGAFVALFIALGLMLSAVWRALPAGVRAIVFLETAVVATAALVAGALLMRVADGRSPAALGIAVGKYTPRLVGLGLLIGAGSLAATALALLITGALRYSPQEGTAGAWLAAVAAQAALLTVAALAEEAVFRGYAFQVLVRSAGPVTATVVSSVLFALAHGANPSIGLFALVNIFLAGILLAIAYLRTLSLWFATAVHMGWNWAMASLFDLPVSGLQVFDTPLYQPVVGGPAWWSGSLFGPEGGLVGTLGFGLALLAVVRWHAVRQDPVSVSGRPLVLRTEEESNVG